MAKSWVLKNTLTLRAGAQVNTFGHYTTDGNTVYFYDYILAGGVVVYSWDGDITHNAVDISGATWTNVKYTGRGICLFSGGLYFMVCDTTANRVYVYKYDGVGTNWTLKCTLEDSLANPDQHDGCLACDSNRIVAASNSAPGAENAFMASTDGEVWTNQTINLGADGDLYVSMLFGSGDHNSYYSEIIAFEETNYNVILHSKGAGAHDWGYAGVAPTTDSAYFNGYGCGQAWFTETTSGQFYVVNSNDWGVTLGEAGALKNINLGQAVWPVDFDYTMGCTGADVNCYLATFMTGRFEADGAIPAAGRFPRCFFSLSGKLYALCVGAGFAYLYLSIKPEDEPELRLLDMAVDSVNLYLTGNGDGTLKLWVYDLPNCNYMRQLSAGAATFADLDNRDRGIFPVVKSGEDVLFLRGRDGNNLQVQMSDDYGVSLTDLSDAGWAAAKYATALCLDPLAPDDVVVVFDDDDIYRSVDAGGAWAKTGDAPVIQREAAREKLNEGNFILAGQVAGAGELHFTPNYGESTADVSDAAMGLINHLEQSL